MSLLNNIILNVYAILILLLVYYETNKEIENKYYGSERFSRIVIVTIIMLVADSLGRFDGHVNNLYPLANRVGNFVLFTMNIILPSIWFLYAHIQIYEDEHRTKKLNPIFKFINLINILLVLGSFNYGWYYSIDQNNIYQRGPYYLVSVFITISILVAAFAMIIKNRKTLEKRYYYSLLFFSIPPLLAIIFQSLFYGVSLGLPAVTISILIVFLKIQNNSIYIDYLTKANNLRSLNIYIKNKIMNAKKQGSFTVISLDLDNFKLINDNFGHDMGDHALIKTVELIRKEISSKDLVARSGGDEFWIVLETAKYEEVTNLIDRLKLSFDEFNLTNSKPYELTFSWGSAVYDYKKYEGGKDFKDHIDSEMYNQKKNKKSMNRIDINEVR